MNTDSLFFNNKTQVVRELTVGDIKELFGMPESATMLDRFTFLLSKSCPELTVESINDMAPSDLDPLIDSILTVNKHFFGQAVKGGMEPVAEALKRIISGISMIALLD